MLHDYFSEYYKDYLQGSYDCVDRIVITAYNPLLQRGGGFRTWWRILNGDDSQLDNTHLMRFAGHFSRRVRAFASKRKIPLIFCDSGTRKHELAEERIPKDPDFEGLFCILVGKSPAAVLDVKISGNRSMHIAKKEPWPYVNQYFFHIIDRRWGHITIKFCPHPPFNAMIILNGHEFVERAARKKGIPFVKEQNCFTSVPDAAALDRIADTMRASSSVGRLSSVCERWIYSTCLCFALDTDEQKRSDFRYSFSVYQLEYSRNLLFEQGSKLDSVFDGVIDRTRSALNIRTVRTIFGRQRGPRRHRDGSRASVDCVIEKPAYDMTVFKINFGKLTAKMYSKGEHVIRIEAVAHNTSDLHCGKRLEKFPQMVESLSCIAQHFLDHLHMIDATCLDADLLAAWHLPGSLNGRRTAGIDHNKPRLHAVMAALIALSVDPRGVTATAIAEKVRDIMGLKPEMYLARQAAYDLKKFRGHNVLSRLKGTNTYIINEEGLRFMAAFIVLQDKVLKPLVASCGKRKPGPPPKSMDDVDVIALNIQRDMRAILRKYQIAA